MQANLKASKQESNPTSKQTNQQSKPKQPEQIRYSFVRPLIIQERAKRIRPKPSQAEQSKRTKQRTQSKGNHNKQASKLVKY